MRKWLGTVVIALFASTSTAQQDTDGSLAKLPSAVREKVFEALDLNLVDGASARFRQVKLEGDYVVCGLINAKTRSGGYSGFHHFAANTETQAILLMSPGAAASTSRIELNDITDGIIRKLCALPSR